MVLKMLWKAAALGLGNAYMTLYIEAALKFHSEEDTVTSAWPEEWATLPHLLRFGSVPALLSLLEELTAQRGGAKIRHSTLAAESTFRLAQRARLGGFCQDGTTPRDL